MRVERTETGIGDYAIVCRIECAAIVARNVASRRSDRTTAVGANWAGPIKNFKLSIDPGGSDRLVSLCAAGLKAVSPNSLEFTAADFKPDADLKILFIGKF